MKETPAVQWPEIRACAAMLAPHVGRRAFSLGQQGSDQRCGCSVRQVARGLLLSSLPSPVCSCGAAVISESRLLCVTEPNGSKVEASGPCSHDTLPFM